MIGVEAALVSSGATSSILLATAACVTGKDPENVRRLPDPAGMKSEVIIPQAQRNGYNHAAKSVGVRLLEVETIEQLKSVIDPKTAMLYWTNIMEWKGKITRREFVDVGKAAGVPLFNDAAAEFPPAENLAGLVRKGFDLVGFSGGKSLRGLQSTGLLLGRRDLIEAAQLNNNPHDDAVGRTCKVGKEELMATGGRYENLAKLHGVCSTAFGMLNQLAAMRLLVAEDEPARPEALGRRESQPSIRPPSQFTELRRLIRRF
jgi:L-seryl-tRNA(Ser) seleniumtransferase